MFKRILGKRTSQKNLQYVSEGQSRPGEANDAGEERASDPQGAPTIDPEATTEDASETSPGTSPASLLSGSVTSHLGGLEGLVAALDESADEQLLAEALQGLCELEQALADDGASEAPPADVDSPEARELGRLRDRVTEEREESRLAVERAERDAANAQRQTARLEQRVQELERHVKELAAAAEDRAREFRGRTAKADETIAALERERGELDTRVLELQGLASELRTQVVGLEGVAQDQEDALENARADAQTWARSLEGLQRSTREAAARLGVLVHRATQEHGSPRGSDVGSTAMCNVAVDKAGSESFGGPAELEGALAACERAQRELIAALEWRREEMDAVAALTGSPLWRLANAIPRRVATWATGSPRGQEMTAEDTSI